MGAVTRDQSGDLRRNPPSLYTILKGAMYTASSCAIQCAALVFGCSAQTHVCVFLCLHRYSAVQIAIKRCCIALDYVWLCHCLMAYCSCLEAVSFYCAPGNIL